MPSYLCDPITRTRMVRPCGSLLYNPTVQADHGDAVWVQDAAGPGQGSLATGMAGQTSPLKSVWTVSNTRRVLATPSEMAFGE